jgi:hypothetical protein
MSVESIQLRQTRSTSPVPPTAEPSRPKRALLIIIAAGLVSKLLVLFGAANLDLNATESRLALAAGEALGPLGQVYGSYEPQLWFGQVLPSWIWAYFHGGTPTSAAVRWPSAIAAVVIVLVVGRTLYKKLGSRATLFFTLACVGSVAWVDRSDFGLGLLDSIVGQAFYRITGSMSLFTRPISPRIDFIAGLCVCAALARLLSGGSGPAAAVWTALGFLAGGWPDIAVILIPCLLIGRSEVSPKASWLWPTALAALIWSYWTVKTGGSGALAGALAWPLTRPPAWTLIAWTFAYALPLAPLGLLALAPSVRKNWTAEQLSLIRQWAMATGALLLVGTFIPGLGDVVRLPIVVGLAIIAGASLDSAMVSWRDSTKSPRVAALVITGLILVPISLYAIPNLGYLAAAVPYYRLMALAVIGLLLGVIGAWAYAFRSRRAWPLIVCLALSCLALKAAHLGLHVPEWNYRASQGPWGRAIGQWIPRSSTLYYVNPSAFVDGEKPLERWPADLSLAVGRRVRQLPALAALALEPGPGPLFVLLNENEFEHWPAKAPKLKLVRPFEDQFGQIRVLARTEGELHADRRRELGE